MMEYNTQEMVTIGYGMEMEKRGIDKGIEKGIEKTEKRFREAIASSGISEEDRKRIMEKFKKLSSE